MAAYIQAVTSIDSREGAQKIADHLVENRLAACVQVIGPVDSTFFWEGKVQREREWLCLAKTKKDLYRRLENEVNRIHPYEEPEIIALPILMGSRSYLDWVEEQVR